MGCPAQKPPYHKGRGFRLALESGLTEDSVNQSSSISWALAVRDEIGDDLITNQLLKLDWHYDLLG